MTDEPDEAPPDPTAKVVVFDYIKAPHFRAVRADGAIGGVTPNGHIHMAIYSERTAIPRRVVHELAEDGTPGPVREVETRASIVREMEVDVYLDLRTAKAIHEWLGINIEQASKEYKG